MKALASYTEYARAALEDHQKKDETRRYLLVDMLKGRRLERILDIGCGPGQELLPFIEKTAATCVGVDVAEGLGAVTKGLFADKPRAAFLRAQGERLPFSDNSFDFVMCRLALPYMNNRQAIAEAARILRPGGVYLVKTHALPFYLYMIRERIWPPNLKALAYPVTCLFASFWHFVTGKQLEKGFWKGKEILQTRRFVSREFSRNNLSFERVLQDNNSQSPSFIGIKETSI